MKNAAATLLIFLILVQFSCKKEEPGVPGIKLPFENSYFKLQDVNEYLPSFTRDIWFNDENKGLLVTSTGEIIKTIDGGKAWDMVYDNPHPDFHFYKLLYLDGTKILAVGGSTSCNGGGCTPPGDWRWKHS